MYTRTKILSFGDISCDLMKLKLNYLAIMTTVTFGGKRESYKYLGGSIMLWECFSAGGTSARHKKDGIMKKEHYAEISKQQLKISARK